MLDIITTWLRRLPGSLLGHKYILFKIDNLISAEIETAVSGVPRKVTFFRICDFASALDLGIMSEMSFRVSKGSWAAFVELARNADKLGAPSGYLYDPIGRRVAMTQDSLAIWVPVDIVIQIDAAVQELRKTSQGEL